MTVRPFQQLACPLNGEPLQREGNTWTCSQAHSFDVAKQGYVNLLPVQNKRSRDPGDSKAMVTARQSFLANGYYQPLAEAVAKAVLSGSEPSPELNCLDAGCGEGYYLRQLVAHEHEHEHEHVPEHGGGQSAQTLNLLGLDISKWAVQSAARQHKEMSWVVGNNANLPVLPATLDWVLCLFGFPVYAEFLRVLKPGGRLLMADAGAEHLRELREIIYPVLKPARPSQNQVPDGFKLVATEQVMFSVLIPSAEQISNLLMMTPHLYRASAEGRGKVEQLRELQLTVDVRLTVLEKAQ